MAIMEQWDFGEKFVKIPNRTARATEVKNNEKPISLEALGLLTNIASYPDSWELHKTELYKRFAFNKERSVKKAWDELINAGYMVEFKYRAGRKWDFVYIYSSTPYTDEQKEIIMAKSREKYGKISGLQNEDLKKRTSKRGPQNADIINTILKKDRLKKDSIKEKDLIDDDEKKDKIKESQAKMYVLFLEFVAEMKYRNPNLFDEDMFHAIYDQMQKQGLEFIIYHEAIEQAKFMKERRDSGELLLADYAAYFVGGIKKKRTSAKSTLDKQDLIKAEKELAAKKKAKKNESIQNIAAPSFDWLENPKE